MNEILTLTSAVFYEDREPEIRSEKFRALMDLCFAHAERFSLRRENWPGANDGALEQALRPFCLGECRSYAAICVSKKKKLWEKCYLYPATEETKAILLRYIPHLFGREPDPAPEGHKAYFQKKYAAYEQAREAAAERTMEYINRMGRDLDRQTFAAFEKEAFREADAIWRRTFDPKDCYSTMEDPCFFRGDEMFFETITHEQECFVHVISDEFGAKLRELGEWADVSDRFCLPLFSLKKAKDLVLY